MRSDSSLNHVGWTRRIEPAELLEWMDEPCCDNEMRECLRDLGKVNMLTLGYRPTLRFLDQLRASRKGSKKLRILDVGFGGGDALLMIERWSRSREVDVELTGIDLNPQAARIAKERYPGAEVEWLTGDALAYSGDVDVVVSSLLTHHLSTQYVIEFIRWMENKATIGWFVNDLERSARSAALFGTLARVMRWHRFVQHDGPVSFARSFVAEDWMRILSGAGVPAGAATVTQTFPARLCVGRVK